ncbi:hypothetical protein VXQ18_06090, partial [Brucella abortus]|nr:hypothetical protein [Brucella abortus]
TSSRRARAVRRPSGGPYLHDGKWSENGSPCPRKALWNRLLEAVFLPGITEECGCRAMAQEQPPR